MKRYYLYILTHASRTSLYTGVTSTLGQRSFQHKHRVFVGFTSKYNVDRLVYFEMFLRITDATARKGD
ncbi:MAG TPA: GIY-YIG nuclease family protein [Terriglobales bacterium]|nr:GIY-YIG nuclease family protein [Terriglobales bacterium]